MSGLATTPTEADFALAREFIAGRHPGPFHQMPIPVRRAIVRLRRRA